jgi:hypothetical protein
MAVVAGSLLVGTPAQAIWVGDATAPYRAQAQLNWLLDVGAFLYLQVGSAGASIDTVRFDLTGLPPASGVTATLPPFGLGAGAPVSASAGGSLTVIVRSNAGAITLSATNNGAGLGLSNGAGQFINYAQITTTSNNSGLPAPVLRAQPGRPAASARPASPVPATSRRRSARIRAATGLEIDRPSFA